MAYCEDVLYSLTYWGPDALQRGIAQMIRVVKPNGLIIAVEPNFGAKFELGKTDASGRLIPQTAPWDMSGWFASEGLRKLDVTGCPPYTYCYQKGQD